MAKKSIQTFKEFWPFYLGEHRLPATRWLHFTGSSFALLLLGSAIVQRNGWFLLAGLLCGYGFAWVSHFFIEKNKPATFTYPLWSFVGDWKMWFLMLTGQLQSEFESHPKSQQ